MSVKDAKYYISEAKQFVSYDKLIVSFLLHQITLKIVYKIFLIHHNSHL